VEQRPAIYLISGPMASGKSTVGRLLASRFERGVHLDGDVFRRSIVSGRSEMTPDPSPAALEQLRLCHRLGAAVADAYFEAGFTVALEDVVPAPFLGDYRTAIRNRPCHVIVLLPASVAAAGFDTDAPRVGIWLDTTDLTPEETVDEILAHTASAPAPVVVAEYDENWATLFEGIARPVREAVAIWAR
jgi:zeta toxin